MVIIIVVVVVVIIVVIVIIIVVVIVIVVITDRTIIRTIIEFGPRVQLWGEKNHFGDFRSPKHYNNDFYDYNHSF